MTRSNVLRLLKHAARSRKLVFTRHALDEMDVEGETRESVAAVLAKPTSLLLQANGRWRVRGDQLTVIVAVDKATVLVWTLYSG